MLRIGRFGEQRVGRGHDATHEQALYGAQEDKLVGVRHKGLRDMDQRHPQDARDQYALLSDAVCQPPEHHG